MSILIDGLTIIYFLIVISATGSTMLQAILAVAILGLIIFAEQGKVRLSHPAVKYLFAFLFTVAAEIFISGNIPVAYLLSRFSMFLPIILFIYYSKRENSTKILNAVLAIWIIIAGRAFYLMYTGQMSARYLAAHMEVSRPFSGGGYAFAIASALLSVYMLDDYLWKKKKNIIQLLVCIFLYIVIILTQSTTTVLAMAIGILFSLGFRLFSVSSLKSMTRKQIAGLASMVLICLFIYLLKDNIGRLIIQMASSGNDHFSKRLAEFGYLFSGNDIMSAQTSDSADRVARMVSSLNVFGSYPIFGVTGVVGTDHYLQAAYGVGSHAELFDALARFGLFAGIPYIGMFISGISYDRNNQATKIGFGYIITFIMLSVFNPFLYSSANCVLFFIIPLMTMVRNNNLQREEK